jgi:hypothetical protein
MAMLGFTAAGQGPASPTAATRIDHIILGINDLDSGIVAFARLTGVTPVRGGSHPGRGTANALVSLGDGHYLEILGPASTTRDSVPTDLAGLTSLTPFGWALGTDDLPALIARVRGAGFTVSDTSPGSRRRPDGSMLTWHTADVSGPDLMLAPFFIQWGEGTAHPSSTSPSGCHLADLKLRDPTPLTLRKLFQAVGVGVLVEAGASRSMVLTLVCPRGRVTFKA